MQLNYFGQSFSDLDLIGNAFSNGEPISFSSTEVVIRNVDTGWVTTITGTGFTFNQNEEPIAGVVSGVLYTNGFRDVAQVTDIAWGLVDFGNATNEAIDFGNVTPIVNLLNSTGGITVDAASSSGGFSINEMFGDTLSQIAVPLNVTGSSAADTVQGGLGDDLITLGSNDDQSDFYSATLGDDTLDFGNATETSFYYLNYGDANGLTFNIGATSGTIVEGRFTDTLINIDAATWGITFNGSAANDVFNVISGGADFPWRAVVGGRGEDTFNLTTNEDGTIRLNFYWSNFEVPTQGLDINVGLGVVANDGFGTSDTINVTYGGGCLSMQGTNFSDVMVGGSGFDEFITQQGNDTVDGGEGSDRIRYDRSGVDAVTVNLTTGVATGQWFDQAFTDTLMNIEQVRGSREGDDSLTGSAQAEYFQGRGGNDTIIGMGGNDTLDGEEGNDVLTGGDVGDLLLGGAGEDTLNGGAGSDTLSGGAQADVLFGGAGGDVLTGGGGNFSDTIDGGDGADQIGGGDGNDVLRGGNQADVVSGGNGQDTIEGGQASDTLAGGNGNDSVMGGQGLDVLIGGQGGDRMFGGDDNDRINGNGSVDVLFGEAGDDVLTGGLAGDSLDGGLGNDTLRGNDGNDTLLGSSGNDRVFGDTGSDLMAGGSGSDLLIGGVGNDTVLGQTGNDTINAGGGDDLVTGGAGTDRFVFVGAFGEDQITDFEEATDTLLLGGYTAGDVTEMAIGADLVLQIDDGTTAGTITIVNGVTDGFDVSTDILFG